MIDLHIERTLQSDARSFSLQIHLTSDVPRIALYGSSGAGKSLTVAAIAGLLTPEQGHIIVGGTTFFDSTSKINLTVQQRRVAYLAQDYGLFSHLTVGQNIAFGLSRGWRNPGRRASLPDPIEQWVEVFELKAVLHSYPDELSGGQKQRVALARAIATQPRLLVLDEPFAALDLPLRSRLRADLAALQVKLGIPSILITHDPADAAVLADQVYRMRQGRVIGNCTPQALLASAGSAQHDGRRFEDGVDL